MCYEGYLVRPSGGKNIGEPGHSPICGLPSNKARVDLSLTIEHNLAVVNAYIYVVCYPIFFAWCAVIVLILEHFGCILALGIGP